MLRVSTPTYHLRDRKACKHRGPVPDTGPYLKRAAPQLRSFSHESKTEVTASIAGRLEIEPDSIVDDF